MQCSAVARLAACVFAALSAGAPHAQGQGDAVTVTPLDADEVSLAQPASVLRGEELRRRQAASIGQTLDREPGVHATGMGPGASRPVIRGLDAPRVRLLENGAGSMDVSTLSPDHQGTVEAFGATQVEVLRGPATLIHGGGAIGGLVNVVNKRIPRDRLEGFAGAAELRLGGPGGGAAALADLNGGTGGFAWHADAFRREAGDYRSPRGRIENSFADASGASVGASLLGTRGHFGIALQQRASLYGVPAAERARIDLDQQRFDASGELLEPAPGLAKARLRLARNRYRHDEIEPGGEVATRFRNHAGEGRIELTHLPAGPFSGVLGISWQERRFSALGEESFLAPVRSRGRALFLVEEARAASWRIELGARLERERHRPEAALPERDFSPTTWSAGAVWAFAPGYSAAVTFTRAQRAPAIEELYANGPHAATATFEIGDPALRLESSRNLDLGLRKTSGAWRWKASVYANRLRNYVFAEIQDVDGDGAFDSALDRVDDSGAPDPAGGFVLVNYRQTRARFSGLEAEIAYRAANGFGARGFADAARGRLEGLGNAPRMSPARLGAELTYARGPWSGFASLLRVLRQDRIAAAQESATPGYTRLDAGLEYRVAHARGAATTLFVHAANLLDRDMRVHTSFLKDRAPLPGRSLLAGLRAAF